MFIDFAGKEILTTFYATIKLVRYKHFINFCIFYVDWTFLNFIFIEAYFTTIEGINNFFNMTNKPTSAPLHTTNTLLLASHVFI